jgi:hypothetical protein
VIGKDVMGRAALNLETENEFAHAYDQQNYAPYTLSAAHSPEHAARTCEFPYLEDAMPRAKQSLFTPRALISPWGWGFIATALTFGLDPIHNIGRHKLSFVVIRRATDATWESIGPRLIEMSAAEAETHARDFAHNHPNQEYAVAEVRKVVWGWR